MTTPRREYNIQREIMLEASNRGLTLFRNNVGHGVQGSQIVHVDKPSHVTLNPGDAWVRNARRVRFGLCVGSSDLIGLKKITITPDMVGKTLAVFTAIEVKTPTGRATKKQKNFIDFVNGAGGISLIARSLEDIPE